MNDHIEAAKNPDPDDELADDVANDLADDLVKKLAACVDAIRRMHRVVVAFSAGVDSTLLLALAVDALGPANVLAAVGVSPSLPAEERQAAREIAEQLDAELVEVTTG